MLTILGQRHVAIDAQNLCAFLDSLVGLQVGEVIMHNLEFRLGKINAARLRTEKPEATVQQLVDILVKSDSLSGIGVTKLTFTENPSTAIDIEITNPAVRSQTGSARSFVFSWWAGALAALLGKELDLKNVEYVKESNTIRCRIVPR